MHSKIKMTFKKKIFNKNCKAKYLRMLLFKKIKTVEFHLNLFKPAL